MTEKKILGRSLCVASLVWLAACSLQAHEATGTTVRIVSTIDEGGAVQTGGAVKIAGFIGEPGVVASSTNNKIVARQGAVGGVYYPKTLAAFPSSTTINEAGSLPAVSTHTQLGGRLTYDDGTSGDLSGSDIAWNEPTDSSGLASISSAGAAQAATVYENTAGYFAGNHAGLVASGLVVVLNTLPDNYRQLAGDTFDDAWEVGRGISNAVDPNGTNNGIPNWQLYAMGFDPSVPFNGQLTEYSRDTSGYLSIVYTRNLYATNYIFRVQESGNLAAPVAGFTDLVNPVSVTNKTTSGDRIVTRGSVPLSATNRQFLRLQIISP